MDYSVILDWLNTVTPWAHYVLLALGGIVVIGTAIDKIIPDDIDHGFMAKVFNIPVLGAVLKAVAKFSPFNVREDK